MRNDRQILQTVIRATEVLGLFEPSRSRLSLSEVARELGLAKSVAYRLCLTLSEAGFLAKDPEDRSYRMGTRVLELSEAVLSGLSLRAMALPFMREVLAATEESVFLNIVSERQSVCIETVESPRVLRLTYGVGRHTPLHAGAPARLLLAFLKDGKREEVLAGPLARFTERTITDPGVLRPLLARIRADGYAWSIGEMTPHVGSVSVPVRRAEGEVVAALSVAGLEACFDSENRKNYRKVLTEAATRFHEAIRHINPGNLLGV